MADSIGGTGAGAPAGGAPAGGGVAPATGEPAAQGTGGEPRAPEGAAAAPSATEEEFYDFPMADSYAWDKWDGESFDTFDEHLQPWLQKAHETWNGKFAGKLSAAEQAAQKAQADAQRWESIWQESLTDAATENPHVREATEKATAAEARAAKATEKAAKAEARLQEYEAQMRAFSDEQSRNYAEWFGRAYPDIVADEKQLDALLATAETLDEEWDTVAELMKLGDTAVNLAKEAKAGGLPSNMLMKWVKTNLKAAERDGVTKAAKSITDSQRLVAENDVPHTAAPPRGDERSKGGKPDLNAAILAAVTETVRKRR